MTRLPSVFEPLDNAADAVIAVSGLGDIHLKRQILDALADGVGFLGNAVSVMGNDLIDAGYGPEISDPVHQAAEAIRSAGRTCLEAISALDGLLNTSVGELASSPHQAPVHTELNGGRP